MSRGVLRSLHRMASPQPVVYYKAEDYLGVMRRLLIDFVDTSVAVVVSSMFTVFAMIVSPATEITVLMSLVAWTGVWITYLVILKGSRFRTLGYVLAGARIVNFSGEQPGYLSLLGRLAFTVLGPFNFVVDLLWVSSDPCSQALRDKVAHTYVVRKDAVPAGVGR
ncbi:MAG TPA: RDD family protein, partial [Thermoanaerobaculia bacterium]|nr:RDD family protein [Thermoanaerobaculia bacterium]